MTTALLGTVRNALPTVASSEVALLWLGQSTFALRFQSATIVVDPFLTPTPDRLVPPLCDPSALAGVDVIACTHEHWDHLDLESLPAMAEAAPEALIVVPKPIRAMVAERCVHPDRVVGMQPDVPVAHNGIEIHAVPARHGVHPDDAYDFGERFSVGEVRYLGYVFREGAVAVYHAGDTIEYDGQAERLRRLGVDVALLPVNGRSAEREALDIVGNLAPEEAAGLALAAGVDLLVPMHYDMFVANLGRPGDVVEALRGHAVGVLVPALGRPLVYRRTVQ